MNSSQQTPPPPINTRIQPMPGQQPSSFNSPGQSVPSGFAPAGIQNYSSSSAPTPGFATNVVSPNAPSSSPQSQTFSPVNVGDPPQLSAAQTSTPLYPQPPAPMGMQTHQTNSSYSSLPPLKPVFGLSLDDLLKRDGSAIPLVVYQCIQAVDLYGLEVEGIYRLSGSSTHVSKLKAIFDNGDHKMRHIVWNAS